MLYLKTVKGSEQVLKLNLIFCCVAYFSPLETPQMRIGALITVFAMS